MKRPGVSVCVPVHNRAGLLQQALESVLAQTFEDFEVIVSDDASSEDIRQVVAALGDSRLRYVRQPQNVGIARNRNRCLASARGHYIAWLDSDDLYKPEMLATQSAVLDKNETVGLVHGAFEVIDESGSRLRDWPQLHTEDRVESGNEAFRELALTNWVSAPTVLVRRECYDRLGFYSPRFTQSGEDWDMWLRIALRFDVAYTAAPVARYRHHECSSSAASQADGIRLRNDRAIIEKMWSSQKHRIPNQAGLWEKATAALAVKTLHFATEQFAAGGFERAFQTTLHAIRMCRTLLPQRASWQLLLSVLRRHEYAQYCCHKALLNVLAGVLEGTRFGERVRRMSYTEPEWDEKRRRIASIIRDVVPPGKRVAAVDKHDPTFLHLSQRSGWHFPDHGLLPGYPRNSEAAITHLKDLRQRGANFLVFPSAAFWWLDHYSAFRQHLYESYPCSWSDEDCIIFQLSRGGRHGHG